MQKITTFLWFDGQAEEAANHYTSIFKNSRITDVARFGEGGPMPAGTVMTASFELEGREFTALNGGPEFAFNESVSFFISCTTQDEVDEYWDKLSDGGQPGVCGWLKDKFGVSWQVIPTALGELLGDPDPQKAGRVGAAMRGMSKIDIQGLRDAHAG